MVDRQPQRNQSRRIRTRSLVGTRPSSKSQTTRVARTSLYIQAEVRLTTEAQSRSQRSASTSKQQISLPAENTDSQSPGAGQAPVGGSATCGKADYTVKTKMPRYIRSEDLKNGLKLKIQSSHPSRASVSVSLSNRDIQATRVKPGQEEDKDARQDEGIQTFFRQVQEREGTHFEASVQSDSLKTA